LDLPICTMTQCIFFKIINKDDHFALQNRV
jgi:hypothetical protein